MILHLLLISHLAMPQEDGDRYYPDADVIAVARYIGHRGAFSRVCEPLDQVFWMHRLRFRLVHVLRGALPEGEVEAIVEDERQTFSVAGVHFKQNSLALIALTKQDSHGMLRGHIRADWKYRSENTAQFAFVHSAFEQYPKLPDRRYQLTGQTVEQNALMILSQAFESTKSPDFLGFMVWPAKLEQAYYLQSVEPALLATAGESDVLRSRVLGLSLELGRVERKEELRALMLKMDREIEDVDADLPYLPAAFRNEPEFFVSMLKARATSFRCAVIEWLAVLPQRRDLMISMLGDPKSKVRYRAIKWLHQLKEEGAPQPKWGPNETVENEAELIAYWRGR